MFTKLFHLIGAYIIYICLVILYCLSYVYNATKLSFAALKTAISTKIRK